MTNPRTDAEVALAAATAGASVVRRLYQQPLARHAKSAIDFATEADLASEDAIRAVLQEWRSEDSFVGEESGESPGGRSDRRWLVDPLCGTLNYAAGTPLAAVNVALHTPVGVTAAASADPMADETFWTDGARAWIRRGGSDAPLEPTAGSRLVDVNCDGEGQFVGPNVVADPDFRAHFGVRVLSTTLALAWVAAGRRAGYVTDGDVTGRAASVHFAAGIALCQAAGCVVTDLAGDPVHAGPGLIAAADASTHRRLLDIVRRHR